MHGKRYAKRTIEPYYHCIRVWNGKGGKHRVMNLANKLTASLHVQITKVKHYLSLDQQDQ
tara:strand:- start:2243 stop:2422 length:180 start_codon:yes stop_codon:yes gene_type:complete